MTRKGMMVGKGSGYKNVIGKDPHVHSQSAKGIKQPQRIPHIPMNIKPKYEITVDVGIPYELSAKSKEELMKKLREIGDQYKDEDMPYLDVKVYEGDKDITDKSFEELDYNNEKAVKMTRKELKEGLEKENVFHTRDEDTIDVDFDDLKSIEKAERKKEKLENEGYNLKDTRQTGFNKFRDRYEKDKDQIKGGLGDNLPNELFDKKQVKKGIKVEREHTNNPKIAKEISHDHLSEDKDYYKKLEKMENEKIYKPKNKIVFYNQDGEVMYIKQNQELSQVTKEISKLNKEKLKWVAEVMDYDKGEQYAIYFDNEGTIRNAGKK